MESRMEEYLNAAISGNTENLPKPISRIDFLLYALVEAISESGASSEDIEKIVSEKIAEVVADSPEDFDTLKEISDWIYTHENSAAAMNTAIQENTNSITSLTTEMNNKANSDDVYDKTAADNTFLGVNATAVKSTADENGENIANNFAAVKNDIAVNKSTLGTQCKNLLKHTAVTTTINGVTFTVNSDGTITANGTATANAIFKFASFTLEAGTYKYSGLSIAPSMSTANMSVFRMSDWVGLCALAEKDTFTITADTKIECRAVIYNGYTANNVVFYPMLRYADITDDTYEPYSDNVDERITENVSDITANKSDIAINKTTLGYQRKNLFDWKNANADASNNVTYTKTDTYITVTSTGEWGRITYKLPVLEIGTKYTFSAAVPALSQMSATTRIRIAHNPEGTNKYIDINLNENGEYKADFTPTESIVYVLFFPNCSATVYTNSFTASNIMLRYADITNDTYEPYKESVDERLIENKSDIAINKTTLGYQRKNLLKPTSSTTRAGVTYTVNEDGSVTLTGKSTTGSTYNYFSIPVTLKPGKYKVNGMPETSKTTTYRTDLRATESGGTTYGYGAKEFEVEFAETTTAYYMIRIDGTYKEELGGVTFYPMIRYADIIDDTYEPYQPSVQEQIAALEARIAALEV